MSKIERFEDIKAWQLAKELTKIIYEVTDTENFSKDFGLKDQIRRAAVSIMANIAEGFERNSNKEFAQFLFVARGSAGELRSHLYVAFEVGYLDKNKFSLLLNRTMAISKSIWGFIAYLKSYNKDKKL